MNLPIKNYQNSAAQATIEYLILLSVLIVILIGMTLGQGNPFQGVLTNTLKERAMTMEASVSYLDNTHLNYSLISP